MIEGINYNVIERSIPYYEGYAGIIDYNKPLNNKDQLDNYLVSATYYKRAAENTLLLSTLASNQKEIDNYIDQANVLLNKSAIHYEKSHYPYAVLLASIARNEEYAEALASGFKRDFYNSQNDYINHERYFLKENYPRNEFMNKSIKAAQYAYLFFTNWNNQSTLQDINNWLYPFAHYRISILGISVNQIINLIKEVLDQRPNSSINYENKLDYMMAPILFAYDDALQIASRDQYRFQHLSMDFHPVNAEVLGLLLQINKIQPGYSLELIEKSSLRNNSKKFLRKLISNMKIE